MQVASLSIDNRN